MTAHRNLRRVLDVDEFVRCDPRDAWRVLVEPETLLPDDSLAVEREKRWRGEHPAEWVGSKLALRTLTREPTGTITARLAWTNWAQVQGWQVFAQSREREVEITESPDGAVRWLWSWPNIAVVHVLIESRDHFLLAAQRSDRVTYHPLAWSLSYEEGLEEADLGPARNPFLAAARRGLSEEIMEPPPSQSFRIAAVIGEPANGNPAIVVLGTVQLTGAEIESRLAIDPEEVGPGGVRLIPTDDATIETLLSGRAEGIDASAGSVSLHPTSRYRLLAYRGFRGALRR